MTFYDIRSVPVLGRDRLSAWGFPDNLHGATLVTSDGPAPRVAHNWVVCAREGQVFDRGHQTTGLGISVVGDLAETDAFISALLQDLLRQPQFRARNSVLSLNWCRWVTASALHRAFRDDSDLAQFYTDRPLLVISPVVVADHWTLATLADLLIARSRSGKPTFIAMSRADYKAVQGLGLSHQSAIHEGLRQIVGYANEIVEL